MPLPPLPPLLLQGAVALASDDGLSRLVTALPALLPATCAALGVGAGMVIGVWVLRTWREYLTGRARLVAPDGAVSLALLERIGVAPRPALEAMSPRERQFLLEVVAPRLAPKRDEPALRPEGSAPAEPRTSVFACPACGAHTVCALIAPFHTTHCLGCRRRITLRCELSGVVVEAEDEG